MITAIPDSIFLVDANGMILKHLSGVRPFGTRDTDAIENVELATLLPVATREQLSSCLKCVVPGATAPSIEFPVSGDTGACERVSVR